jgi:hypothetical protein
MAELSAADRQIRETAKQLEDLLLSLGDGYWQDKTVSGLQDDLRRQIRQYGAWAADKLPMHQRARQSARYESQYAHLLWPRT